ncbi:HAD-IA family hydrolase [Alicyclobacillus tolerans]|uniref:HAD-IA family hydrolase n=1 Tax=Alicyclobacillus tolerans TaxID=90970 RepID=UPI001F02F56D|nr:HAD-IA family hydrolase [Alicyclobacillus tolerans]MCF8566499.1 HAD-IA family hydrolase [Alicyclobacillus tolerans]
MIKAILFDQDGVIIDSERNGHRIAFEKAFQQFGYDIQWDPELYHQLLQIGGGKERLKYYFERVYSGNKPKNLDEFVLQLHDLKTALFIEMLETAGTIPLRPGIRRFMNEANQLGIPIGICTTSNERVARTVVRQILKGIHLDLLIAGDMVREKKPDPEIYLRAIDLLEVKASETLVVEDSNIGVRAAKAAGCRVLCTYTQYTQGEDLSDADIVVSALGDADEQARFSTPPIALKCEGIVSVQDLLAVF